MCYFDQIRWKCGYWRWGPFRQQCIKESRTGETCGLKLINQVYDHEDKCKLCYDIDKKVRRIAKMSRDIERWQGEGNRTATIERTQDEAVLVQRQMEEMHHQHWRRVQGADYS
ncbi:unnamed protein product [Parascedosporium putredinis]|uniref:Uncharacterized protein n=1 Tax=Parascedosporium putredinis TaxID=1442378 RepID=A0A9P1HCZ0_9PEZI|nr:unnamed protein product [Parascedosporium putredinis]CAI8004916.1 unnamed protein product [Parascedosporium putredinis]